MDDDLLKNPIKSRRFWIAAATVILNAAIAAYPPLEQVREQLISTLSFLAVTLIGGLSLTHAANRVEPLWKSRRFWVAVGAATLNIAVALWPPLQQVQAELIDVIAWIGMTLVAGLTVTDVALLRGWTKWH